tara:strand:+ start:128 stop:628 length:501 start_codon:yes stop_codon:yes gene_type:complete
MKEVFKDVLNYEGIYQVSDLGNVKSLKFGKERVLKQCINANGYLKVNFIKFKKTKSYKVHQLVAMAFLNHKPCGLKLVVNHIDFNRTNNYLCNLEITTQRENASQKHLNSSSKYTGVCWDKSNKKWRSQITINGKNKCLGRFKNELDASKAYQIALNNVLKNLHSN